MPHFFVAVREKCGFFAPLNGKIRALLGHSTVFRGRVSDLGKHIAARPPESVSVLTHS